MSRHEMTIILKALDDPFGRETVSKFYALAAEVGHRSSVNVAVSTSTKPQVDPPVYKSEKYLQEAWRVYESEECSHALNPDDTRGEVISAMRQTIFYILECLRFRQREDRGDKDERG